jgi:hypothetical protein
MIGDLTAYYLNEQEFKTAVEINKKFDPAYIPYLVIEIVQHYNDHNSFICFFNHVHAPVCHR